MVLAPLALSLLRISDTISQTSRPRWIMTVDDRTLPPTPFVPPVKPSPSPEGGSRPRLGIRDQMPPLGLTEYWYPAVPAAKVGRRKPLRRRLLGQDVVFFRGKKATSSR